MLKELITKKTEESNHLIVIGSRGAGKTSLGSYLLELHNESDRKCYIYNHPNPSLLPKWINNITKLENLPENAVVLIDETANDFDQYSYAKQTNKYLRNLLTIARHKNQSYIFIALTTKFLNVNFLHMIDCWFFKKPTIFQREEERKLVRKAYAKVQEELEPNEFYFMDDSTWLKGKFQKPKWYSEKLSKAYANVEAEEI